MTMADSYTAYFSPGLRLFAGDVGEARDSNILPRQFRELFEHPCLSYLVERLVLAATDNRNIAPMLIGAKTDNARVFAVARVIGEIKITTVGNDSDDNTIIGGVSQSYGTAYLPGFLVLNTYNLDSITLEAVTASTVDILTGVLALSTDSRL